MADAEQTLRDLLDEILDAKDYRPRDVEVQKISMGGTNYTSALFAVNVSSPSREILKLFAKVAIVGDAMRDVMNADWLFDTERFIYTELVDIYKEIQDEQNVPEEHRFVFPKFYGYKADIGKETIIMENLTESGYESYDRLKSMDWEHGASGVENIAKFHALSFAFQKHYPEKFTKKTKNMIFRTGSAKNEENGTANDLWMQLIDNNLQVIKGEEKRLRVKDFIVKSHNMNQYNRPLGKPVLSHGDYRLSNVLFKRQDDKLQSIVVDFQTVHAGCPVSDLIYFIFIGSDEEFRAKYYHKLLDHYYTSLEQALRRLSVDPVEAYPREKFESDLKELLPYAIIIGVAVLPVVTVDVESAPRLEGDADVTGFLMKPNELYAERFNGIVNDCIRWGVI